MIWEDFKTRIDCKYGKDSSYKGNERTSLKEMGERAAHLTWDKRSQYEYGRRNCTLIKEVVSHRGTGYQFTKSLYIH